MRRAIRIASLTLASASDDGSEVTSAWMSCSVTDCATDSACASAAASCSLIVGSSTAVSVSASTDVPRT